MDTITFENDIKVFYIEAKSFPEGVKEAYEKLHSLFPFSTSRKYLGLSRPENGKIVYKAAAEEIEPGEAEKYNCKSLTLKKGEYISKTIQDFMKDISAIGKTFEELLKHPNLDPNGYCVEWYFNDSDVKCMIRLDQ